MGWVAPLVGRWFEEKWFRTHDLIGVWPTRESVVMIVRDRSTELVWAWRPVRDSVLDREPTLVDGRLDPSLGAPWEWVPDRDEPRRHEFVAKFVDLEEPPIEREEDGYRSASWAETMLSHCLNAERSMSISPDPVVAGFVEHSSLVWLVWGVDPSSGPFDSHERWLGVAWTFIADGSFGAPWSTEYAGYSLGNLYGLNADFVAEICRKRSQFSSEADRPILVEAAPADDGHREWFEVVIGLLDEKES
ncbi:hypothetical protein CGZ91_12990 [Parenemella sanctibonifatiensis]|uniref:Uncharacterized protein n=1 Tax=Parenemella sanctibonifatiensis TaxID=2016505 RepID=A0A255EM05_9ACTN|nr:hypothetical protein CGZ91_12990 [Parenemella sanctibonifatiensis]